MRLVTLSLKDFRNYPSFELDLDRNLTVLVGENAVGKTNALEAIRIITTGKSFRKSKSADFVRRGSTEALVSAAFREDRRVADTTAIIPITGRKLFRINGTPVRTASALSGILPTVAFTPDDLYLVKGPAELRREMLDDLGETISPAYAARRKSYTAILRQRNAALRERLGSSLLGALTEQLADEGAALQVHRKKLARKVAEKAAEVYAGLSGGESLEIAYSTPYLAYGSEQQEDVASVKDDLVRALRTKEAEEEARQTTLCGPHKDDLVIEVCGQDARAFSSQGQQRTAALSLKLAEVAVVQEAVGVRPLLLLDDVMSELDDSRRASLAGLIHEGVQTVVTTTNAGYFDAELLQEALVLEVRRERR